MDDQEELDDEMNEVSQLHEASTGQSVMASSAANFQTGTLVAAVSGLYVWEPITMFDPVPHPLPIPDAFPHPIPGPTPVGPGPLPETPQPTSATGPQAGGTGSFFTLAREELRLDVDGRYPQMTASGVVKRTISSVTNWVANLTQTGPDAWKGTIWYKDGDKASFPYTSVHIKAYRSRIASNRCATVTFSGGAGPKRVREFKFNSPFFHEVNFEFDHVTGKEPIISMKTCAHPNRPAGLACETLTIEKVYNRAGFKVTTNQGGEVPISGSGSNALWSDQEMHDAMQVYWSRFANKAQWAMWTFFASMHETGTNLGGVMFDSIGPNHRQGTSIFTDSFIATPPTGEPNPADYVRRMIFWTACHEMGHSFNLAHSWQKSLGTSWIPLSDEPEARSFMNYPFKVTGGQTAFFANFEFRFSDAELLFMRHAPESFVQQGNATWFDHHGFQSANASPEASLKLALRANRDLAIFEFMEPVTLELKLTNVSDEPELVDENVLSVKDSLTVIIKKDDKEAREYSPFAQYCLLPKKRVLNAGESVYESLFISAGLNGWDIADPGNYTVQVALHKDGEDIVSNPQRVRVAPPHEYKEEYLAQDFFSEDVGRIIALDGSRFLNSGNDVLREVSEQLGDRRVAIHAKLALGTMYSRDFKELVASDNATQDLSVKVRPAKMDEAKKLLDGALIDEADTAAESLGHFDYKWYIDQCSERFAKEGDKKDAASYQDVLYKTFSNRKVHGRKVLDSVLAEIKDKCDSYSRKTSSTSSKVSKKASKKTGKKASKKPGKKTGKKAGKRK
jgi:hypothetical protein